METTSYKTVLISKKRRTESNKEFWVAIPMRMYRIKSYEISFGLNFFQKTVLRLRIKPRNDNKEIAGILGLDEKLVALVEAELQALKLLTPSGAVSKLGKEKMKEVEGLVANTSKTNIGYVFKYANQDKLYPYVVNNLEYAQTTFTEGKTFPAIVTGSKGDEDYTERPHFLNEANEKDLNTAPPEHKEIAELIARSVTRSQESETGSSYDIELENNLGIQLLDTEPELVWWCTKLYLPKNDDGSYSPDWQVLHPVYGGYDVHLKFFLKNLANERFRKQISYHFDDAKVISDKRFSDFNKELEERVEATLLQDFAQNVTSLDRNLVSYTRSIVESYILLEKASGSDRLKYSLQLTINLQNALENILKQDKEQRSEFYDQVYHSYPQNGTDKRHIRRKQNALNQIFNSRILSVQRRAPSSLWGGVCRSDLSRGSSLRHYLTSWILTYNFSTDSILFQAFKNRIEIIDEIAGLRNNTGHGKTEREGTVSPLSSSKVGTYYTFYKNMLNDYCNAQ